MPGNDKDFLGRGWAFPVAVNKATGQVRLSEYEEDIAQAIRIILTTRRGERVMRPTFGSDLHNYLFEVPGYGVQAQIAEEVVSALETWEPRIIEVTAEAEFPEGSTGGFVVKIDYTVRSTNNPFNLVFPFFLTEGNN